MRIVVMSMAILSLLAAPALAGDKKKKTEVKTCSSYTNINGTTKTTCYTR